MGKVGDDSVSQVAGHVGGGAQIMMESGKKRGLSKNKLADMEKDYQDSLVEKSKYEPSQRSKL